MAVVCEPEQVSFSTAERCAIVSVVAGSDGTAVLRHNVSALGGSVIVPIYIVHAVGGSDWKPDSQAIDNAGPYACAFMRAHTATIGVAERAPIGMAIEAAIADALSIAISGAKSLDRAQRGSD